jgi:hypothetical protein
MASPRTRRVLKDLRVGDTGNNVGAHVYVTRVCAADMFRVWHACATMGERDVRHLDMS